jgi:SPP1 gp7 family putative phage head morphogenesis protein
MGIEPSTLLKRDGMTYDFNALTIETTQWIEKLRDETLEMYTANTLRSMTLGTSIEDILKEYDGMVEKRKNHARFTARNQVASFNSIMNKTRAQKLGITEAKWVTSHDERVRSSHEQRDGKIFELSVGLYSSMDGKTLLPGVDYNCRCSYRMILEDEE